MDQVGRGGRWVPRHLAAGGVAPSLRRIGGVTVILYAQTCPTWAGSRHAPPEMGEEAS